VAVGRFLDALDHDRQQATAVMIAIPAVPTKAIEQRAGPVAAR
jgi:hypothetical protein